MKEPTAAGNARLNRGIEPTRGGHERLPEDLKKIKESLAPIARAEPLANLDAMAMAIRRENRLANRGTRPRPRHKLLTTNVKKLRSRARRRHKALALAARRTLLEHP